MADNLTEKQEEQIEKFSNRWFYSKKSKKKGFAVGCAIGALALIGCAGTIAFGHLWCQARENPDVPTTDLYLITFDLDGGHIDGLTGDNMQVVAGTTYGILPLPRKDNMSFDGWLVNGQKVLPNDPITASVSVKATWIDEPTPSCKLEWTGNIESKKHEDPQEGPYWTWDITNPTEYESKYEPIEGQEFDSNKDALETYSDAIVKDNLIYANDLMINCIYNMFNPKIVIEETSVFWCPNPFIDTYFGSDVYTGQYKGWTTTKLSGTSDFSLELMDIYYDNEHKCVRVSNMLNILVDYQYTIKDDDSAETVTFNGFSELTLHSKNMPFQFYYDYYNDPPYYQIPGWATFIPDDFAHIDESGSIEGWGKDDHNWSLDIALNNCTIFDGELIVNLVTTLVDPELSPWIYYDYRNITNQSYLFNIIMIDLWIALFPGWDDNGCYYLKNCSVKSE